MRTLPLAAIAAPALTLAFAAASTIVMSRDGSVVPAVAVPAVQAQPQVDVARPDRTAAPRRWPAEIEHLISSMPQAGAAPDAAAPMIESDQRCSRVDDGLAHCVMLECQTAGGQTACFEMVVTARRLDEPPVSMQDGGDEQDEGTRESAPDDSWAAPRVMGTRSASSL